MVFKSEPGDYSVDFMAYDFSFRFKPLSLSTSDMEISPSFDLRYIDEDVVEYRDVFGDGINLRYESEDDRLKEYFILLEKEDVSLINPSSSTMTIRFSLLYPDSIVPSLDGESGWGGSPVTTDQDIVFIKAKESRKLFSINKYFRIMAPHLLDNSGRRLNLTYSLIKQGTETLLSLNIPPLPPSLEFPVVIDPTLDLDEGNDCYEWWNEDSCSTETYSCDSYDHDDNVRFEISDNCNTGGQDPVRKPMFSFDTNGLSGDYDGDVLDADLCIYGSCSGQNSLEDYELIELYEIVDFGTPSCEGSDDDNVTDSIEILMTDDVCTTSKCIDITNNFQSAVNNQTDISFKIDINPARNDTFQPSSDIRYSLDENDIHIAYNFTCDHSSECKIAEFCKDASTDYCEDDLDYGGYCEGIEVNGDDEEACPDEHEDCQYDDFDESGYYCVEANKCVHNGTRFDQGDIHCYGDSWYKTCQADETWTTKTNCSFGCEDGTGCLTQSPLQLSFSMNQSSVLAGNWLLATSEIQNGSYPLDAWWFEYNNTIGNTTSSPLNGSNTLLWDTSGLLGNYSIFSYVNDTASNTNKSSEVWVNIITTTTLAPNIVLNPSSITIRRYV